MESLRNDKWIKRMVKEHNLIENFVPNQVAFEGDKPVISYGLSSYGYDLRLGTHFRVITQKLDFSGIIDPKNIDESLFVSYETNEFVLPAYSYALGESIEKFNLPSNIFVILLGKSTYARCGLVLNTTPGEPKWNGKWTLEFANPTACPIRLYSNEGIGQAVFLKGEEPAVTYAMRRGKYQNQPGIVLPKV
jgi:dCTP deaminase